MSVTVVTRWHLTNDNRRDTVVTLPLRLSSPQNGSHGHWAPQAARRKRERQASAWGCGGPLAEYRVGLAKGYLSHIRVTIERLAPRALDSDNAVAAAKSVRDGIADALGLKDDSDARLTWCYGQEKAKEYAVRVTVEGRA